MVCFFPLRAIASSHLMLASLRPALLQLLSITQTYTHIAGHTVIGWGV